MSAMQARLVHRGPDGEGRFVAGQVGLAMRRLGIIDLAHGAQPLYNEDRTLALVANGEIYNYVELQAELRAGGHGLATGSDCETIVHLYEEHGPDCVHKLRGMFAFALWDQKRKRLVLARDRMGEKPLYLYETARGLVFASELKALLRSGMVPFVLDPVGVNLFFHYQYVPEPASPVRGVRKLEAAHVLTVEVDDWTVRETRYWDMEKIAPVEGDPARLIRQELEDISRIVIRSDVPVGIALSGGLDSSAVAALSAKTYPGTLQAFSIGYAGQEGCDERAEARALAKHLGIPFHDVELATSDVVSFFPELNYWRDDPVADIAGHGYHAVMKLAREHGVPVILQGQGGDELFWGYSWVRQALRQSEEKDALLQGGWRAMAECLRPVKPYGWEPWQLKLWLAGCFGLKESWERRRRWQAEDPDQLVFVDLLKDYVEARNEMPGLYAPGWRDQVSGAETLFSPARPWPRLDILMTRLICDTYLRGNGVAQGDRLSMASSVEMRLPFLDHKLIERVIGLRKARTDSRLPPKAWLKASVQGLVPDWVMNRPKRGFMPPVEAWHRALFKAYGKELEDGFLVRENVLSREGAVKLASGETRYAAATPLCFKALVLEYWCRAMRNG